MAQVDRSEIKQLVRDLRTESIGYNRQWLNWLGVASGGGAVASLSFAANLPDPDYALRVLLSGISAFAAGVCFAGFAVLTAARRVNAAEVHHAAAFTRDELGDAIRSTPLMISAPRSMAERHNAPRDKMIADHDIQHEIAENAWTAHLRWKWLNRVCLGLSVVAFVVGISTPLAHIALGGSFSPNATVQEAVPPERPAPNKPSPAPLSLSPQRSIEMDGSSIVVAIIGLIGVPLGVFLGEFLRRRQRSEQFAAAIFAKRLEAYEVLLGLLDEGGEIAEQVISNTDLNSTDRHNLISEAISPIAKHVDRSTLYIDAELGAHCTALYMGVEDIPDLPEADQQSRLEDYRQQRRETRRMILEESGVAKVNKVFRDINRPRITSPVIERIRELQREQDKAG